ncbi:hypothetical protein AGMMS50256_12280 [Betaproteobacteria bacterium]|nr:hypothetical protein AGMMS50256_12280 [Betaproteobacteria bacterium]
MTVMANRRRNTIRPHPLHDTVNLRHRRRAMSLLRHGLDIIRRRRLPIDSKTANADWLIPITRVNSLVAAARQA